MANIKDAVRRILSAFDRNNGTCFWLKSLKCELLLRRAADSCMTRTDYFFRKRLAPVEFTKCLPYDRQRFAEIKSLTRV